MADPEKQDLEIKLVSREGTVVRLEAVGRLVHSTLAPCPDLIDKLLGSDAFAQTVLLSLEGVDFMDSSGIGWLLASRKQFREAGGSLVIHSVPAQVLDVIRVMRLGHVLGLAEDESAAMAMVQGVAG
jgi:stage II sporulation protein AA (anti-sigma F factor antagonist)